MKDMNVFWISLNGDVTPYDKAQHAFRCNKFLYWKNGGDGKALLIAGMDHGHEQLLSYFLSYNVGVTNKKPDGVGRRSSAFADGVDWYSVGFDIETPDIPALRSLIKKTLW